MIQEQDDFKYHLIDHFRNLVAKRYQYDHLNEIIDLPESFDEADVDKVRDLFLESIYPPPEDRKLLDDAFKNLRSYIVNPVKAIGLLGNIAVASLKFGPKLPQAIRAGMLSLDSYLSAKRFEEQLYKIASEKHESPPITEDQFKEIAYSVPEDEAQAFLKEISGFLHSLTDTELLKKTVEILNAVTARMEKRPRLYSKQEIDGIRLGTEILSHGHRVFSGYSEDERARIVDIIVDAEEHFLSQRPEENE